MRGARVATNHHGAVSAPSSQDVPSTSESPDPEVRRVLIVSKTHLDVGFTDLAALVRRRYLDDFFPRAMAVAAELRQRGGPERLRWTTGSWILDEALEAARPSERRQLDDAIEAGDLCWHALPFTLHTEYCDRSLVEHGLSIAARLDDRYGRRTRAAKVTDVPGHTRGLVSLLAEGGIELLHVGVNPASSPPRVPDRFRWVDRAARLTAGGDAPELLVMYQPGGYGAVQVLPGTGTAVAVDLTGDNLGPPTAEAVVAAYARLRERFPAASIEAGTFDDVAREMAAMRDDLPVVTSEIGDTWIHGVGSDPAKTAAFRALRRERSAWLDDGSVEADDPVLRRASTRLLLVGEHTWGMDQKEHWPELAAWGAQDLAAARQEPATARFESSWAEQRDLLEQFVALLDYGGRPDLATRARAARAATEPVRPSGDGWDPVEPGEVVDLGGWQVGVDPADGAVVHLCDAVGRTWATRDRALARFGVQTFDAADFERWFSTYNGATLPEDLGWARWDNTKPGLADSGALARWLEPAPGAAWRGECDGRPTLVIELGFDVPATDPVAVPGSVYLTISAGGDGAGEVELRLSWFDLPAARWPVAWWWSFAPAVQDDAAWCMEKLGELVSPLDVVPGGAHRLHAADRLVHPDVSLDLVDAPLVAPGAPRLLEWDDEPVDLRGGWHLCLYDNLWGTNFPMWIEGDGSVRVVLRPSGAELG